MVEEWTGIIRTVAHLDRERVPQYSLILQAHDSSLTEPRSATTQVRVRAFTTCFDIAAERRHGRG